jgi:4-hydroxybenzoate polyprenyltransferase
MISPEPVWLTVIRLLRWDKPAGRLILMIPALWAVILASAGRPPWQLVGIIIVGTMATSGAGCVINDIWDRNLDPLVERTKTRPLASKSLSLKVAIGVGLLSLFSAAMFAFYLNPLSFWLSALAVPVIVIYPLAKRVFPVPQLVLAVAWGFAVLISWSAVTAKIEVSTILLWLATITWTLGFDTVYAMADRDDDRKIGVNSAALFFGKFAPEAIIFFYALSAIFLALMAIVLKLNWSFWPAWTIASITWIWQYIRLKYSQLVPLDYGRMFAQNVTIGFILMLGMLTGCLF